MKKDNILGIVVMGCGLLLALCVFLPYVSYYSNSISLWKAENASRFIYILLGLFVIVLFLINKKTEMAYITAGYGTFNAITQIISNEGFEGLSIAFYLILLTSIAIGIITFIYDESKADALINFSVKVNKPVMNQPMNNGMYNQSIQSNNQPMNNGMYNQPMQSNNQLMNNGMYNQPMNNPQMQESTRAVRFDPMTGQTIYYDQNNN